MKSIIEEALARNVGTKSSASAQTQTQSAPVYTASADDEELMKILESLKVNIKIFGCGGGGSNTINRMVDEGITGAEMFAANTDARHLHVIHAPRKILLGKRLTRGLGAGANPKVGEESAREAEEDLKRAIQGADIVFVTCGMGGGTGTGSAPYIAKLAKESNALVMSVVTLPFKAEGQVRMQNALYGLDTLRKYSDTVIVIPNDKLLEIAPKLPLDAAFKVADEILMRSIKGITEIITKPGLVNLDFNDLKTIMKGGGVAMIGIGEAEGDKKAEEAVNDAIHSPLLDVDISTATGAMISVTGGSDMTVTEAQRVVEIVGSKINPNARIIWGAAVDPALERKMRVLLVVTGVRSKQILGPQASGTDQKKVGGVDFLK
ncbi:MAG: cell division protein FtsZ [Thermoplasmata archaeon]